MREDNLEERFAAMLEAQRWCLGLGGDLSMYKDMGGFIAPAAYSTQASLPNSSSTDNLIDGETAAGLRAWKEQIKREAAEHHLVVTSEYRPGAITHATRRASWHSKSIDNEHGMALDVSGSKANMAKFFQYVKQTYDPSCIREMFYSPEGQVVRGSFLPYVRNPVTREDHYDHVHIALGPIIKRNK